MVVLRGQPDMYSCRVLYIGSASPSETLEGVEALQEPLNLRYPDDLTSVEGIDSTLTVHPDRITVQYTESGQVVEYPLGRLKICAAVRSINVVDAVSGEPRRRFVPVNQVECDKDHPAIFSAILRRTQGRQIQECHSFICNSPRDALHLVNATATANMAIKGKGGGGGVSGQHVEQTYVVQNGYQSDDSRREIFMSRGPERPVQQREEVIVVKATGPEMVQQYEGPSVGAKQYDGPSIGTTMAKETYQIRSAEAPSSKPETIYITFDKSGLLKKEKNTYQITQRNASFDYQTNDGVTLGQIDDPSPSPRMGPMVPYGGPPPPRGPPIIVQGPPRFLHGPPPPMIRGPPPRMMYGPPPPRPPPPAMMGHQARMYERRMMSPPPPRMMVAPPQQMYTQTRARSASPARYASSDIRMTGKYQPRWRSHNSEFAVPPPKNYFKQNMFMNERAFSNRINGDSRISRSAGGFYGYQPGHASYNALYDRPVTKSNPKYSSSESLSDDDRDNRFDRRARGSRR